MPEVRRLIAVVAAGLCFAIAAEHAISIPPPPQGHAGLNYAEEPWLRDAQLERLAGESSSAYAARLSREIFRRSYFCGPEDVPLSWIERGLRWRHPRAFYLGVLDRRRIECGTCGNKAFVMMGLLAEGGVRSEMLFLSHHVVLRLADGRIVDSTFGVGPFRWTDWRTAYRGVAGFTSDIAGGFLQPARTLPDSVAIWQRDAAQQRFYFPLADALAWLIAVIGVLFGVAAIKVRNESSSDVKLG